jgi:hypothetical protein
MVFFFNGEFGELLLDTGDPAHFCTDCAPLAFISFSWLFAIHELLVFLRLLTEFAGTEDSQQDLLEMNKDQNSQISFFLYSETNLEELRQ